MTNSVIAIFSGLEYNITNTFNSTQETIENLGSITEGENYVMFRSILIPEYIKKKDSITYSLMETGLNITKQLEREINSIGKIKIPLCDISEPYDADTVNDIVKDIWVSDNGCFIVPGHYTEQNKKTGKTEGKYKLEIFTIDDMTSL